MTALDLDPAGSSLQLPAGPFATVLADPPWRHSNRTGKSAAEHSRLARYSTMSLDEICALPIADLCASRSHLYIWAPNSMLPAAFQVVKSWGFTYKTYQVWHKIRKDGGSDGRCMGFYVRDVTELLLFGTRTPRKHETFRTGPAGRRMPSLFAEPKREYARKPEAAYERIEQLSPGPYLELFARHLRPGWSSWGDQLDAAS